MYHNAAIGGIVGEIGVRLALGADAVSIATMLGSGTQVNCAAHPAT